jgi:thiol-disulfide isomerase/thioredoxin
MMLAMRAPLRAPIVVLLACAGAGCAAPRPQLGSSPALGRPVDVVAPDLRGETYRVADTRGPVQVVTFWATWCEPCLAQFPVLELLVRAHQADGLAVHAVAVDEDQAQVAAFVEATVLPFRFLWDKGGARHAERIGIERLPATLLVDRAGKVRFVHQGYRAVDAGRLDREVRALLTEPQ